MTPGVATAISATSAATLRAVGKELTSAPVFASSTYTQAPLGLAPQTGAAVFASSQVSYPPPTMTTGPVWPSTLVATTGVDQVCPMPFIAGTVVLPIPSVHPVSLPSGKGQPAFHLNFGAAGVVTSNA